tara:strand:- start:335 stop:661 length:327 start_codon:yes stop_codon:yes gene_type:complete
MITDTQNYRTRLHSGGALDQILDALTSANPRWWEEDSADRGGCICRVQAWPVSNTAGNTPRDHRGPCVWRVMLAQYDEDTAERIAYGAAPSMAEAMAAGEAAAAKLGY